MKPWYKEDWTFTVEVQSVGIDNSPRSCRLGFEPGDRFECRYECPNGFCPKSMLKLFPVLEAVRSGGDLRSLGGDGPRSMDLLCPDGVVIFRVTGRSN